MKLNQKHKNNKNLMDKKALNKISMENKPFKNTLKSQWIMESALENQF